MARHCPDELKHRSVETYIMFVKTICFFAMLCTAHGTLLQEPEDTEAVVGQSQVVLKCRTGSNDTAKSVEWRHRKVHTDVSFQIVYKRGFIIKPYNDRYRVQNETAGHYDLIIERVQLDDAGTYTCDYSGWQFRAELIVFEKYPSNEFCTTTSLSDGNHNNCGLGSVFMSCDMRYRGNLVPVLEWWNGENSIPSTITNDTHEVTKSYIQLSRIQIENSHHTCRVRYLTSMITSRFTWSPTVNTTITATTTSLSHGGCDLKTIDCSDENSPQCKYTWLAEDGTEVTNSFSMDLTGKPNGNYTCEATCTVHETPCNHVTKILNYKCHNDFKQVTSITSSPVALTIEPQALESLPGIISPGIYVPVSILVIVILIVIILLLIFRRSLCVCRGRTSTRKDAVVENGQMNNTTEMIHLSETTPQGTTSSLKRNNEMKQVNILQNGASNIHELLERNTPLLQS